MRTKSLLSLVVAPILFIAGGVSTLMYDRSSSTSPSRVSKYAEVEFERAYQDVVHETGADFPKPMLEMAPGLKSGTGAPVYGIYHKGVVYFSLSDHLAPPVLGITKPLFEYPTEETYNTLRHELCHALSDKLGPLPEIFEGEWENDVLNRYYEHARANLSDGIPARKEYSDREWKFIQTYVSSRMITEGVATYCEDPFLEPEYSLNPHVELNGINSSQLDALIYDGGLALVRPVLQRDFMGNAEKLLHLLPAYMSVEELVEKVRNM